MALDKLATAYAERGKFDEATKVASKAIDAASAAGNDKLAKEIHGRLERYRQGVP